MRDSLDGIEARSSEVQTAILVSELRQLRGDLAEVRSELTYMKRALYGLMFTILGGTVVFLVTIASSGHPLKHGQRLVVLTVLAGMFFVAAVWWRSHEVLIFQRQICVKVNRLDLAMVVIIENARTRLPPDVYLRDLDTLRGASCNPNQIP